MQKLIPIILLCCLTLFGCAGPNSSDLAGAWSATPDQDSRNKKEMLSLHSDGRFSAKNFPALVACLGEAEDIKVNGHGQWNYDSESGQLHLNFIAYSHDSCTVPYGAIAFVEAGMRGNKIYLYPDGVDNLSSRIYLTKAKSPVNHRTGNP